MPTTEKHGPMSSRFKAGCNLQVRSLYVRDDTRNPVPARVTLYRDSVLVYQCFVHVGAPLCAMHEIRLRRGETLRIRFNRRGVAFLAHMETPDGGLIRWTNCKSVPDGEMQR